MSKRAGLLALLLAASGCAATPAMLSVTALAPKPPAAEGALTPGRGVGAQGAGEAAESVPGQAIVKLRDGVTPEAFFQDPRLAGFGRKAAIKLRGYHLVSIAVPEGMAYDQVRRVLSDIPAVAMVSPDYVAKPLAAVTPNDPLYPSQWAHQAGFANTTAAWDAALVSTSAQANVIVAVLDTGLDVSHPEFEGRVVARANYTYEGEDELDVTDDAGHGTHVAGIIGAAGNDGRGVAGVAWNVKLLPMKVLGQGAGTFAIVAAMLDAARFRHPLNPETGPRVRVINMSLGMAASGTSVLFADAVAECRENGVVVVAATGNDGRNVVNMPASTPGVVAVGSTARYLGWESLSSYSNHGPRVDLVAPGESILSTWPVVDPEVDTGYDSISGTSMASPYVAGVAALITARYGSANTFATPAFADKVVARLKAAVDDLGAPGRDPLYGEGRLNAHKALAPAMIDAAP